MCNSPNCDCGCKTKTKIPADWSYLKAYKMAYPTTLNSDESILTQKSAQKSSIHHRMALYIESKEEPPIDPDLVLARETVANTTAKLSSGYAYTRDQRHRIKEGTLFTHDVNRVLEGIKLGKSLC